MATGDAQDVLARLKAVLPSGWFPDSTPILDGLLSGIASTWAWTYSFLAYVKQQSRLLTMAGVWLDLFAADYFHGFIVRRVNETDAAFRVRIRRELFREKGTRAGLIHALVDLTGNVPTVFEPAYANDTGGYGHTGMTVGTGLGYGMAGGYGTLALPFQYFVTVFPPSGSGVANVGGYYTHRGWAGGGYGVGALEYASRSMIAGPVTLADIYNTVNDVRPVGTIAWVATSGASIPTIGVASLTIDPVVGASHTAGFSVTGSIGGQTAMPSLSYIDDPALAAVVGLVETATSTSITLSWTAETDVTLLPVPPIGVSLTAFAFTHPALAAGVHTLTITTGTLTATISFTVS
jgi:hypothetical protein